MERLIIEQCNFQQYLNCPKCQFIIENPYEIECCGTLFCFDCVQLFISGKENEKCMKCFKNAIYRPNSFLKRIINQINLNCSFGCGNNFPSNEIKNHMISCELRQYKCNICGYNKRENNNFCGNKKELILHLIQEHERDILDLNDNFQSSKLNQIESDKKKKLCSLLSIEESKDARYGAVYQGIQMRTQTRNMIGLNDSNISNSRRNEDHNISDNSYQEYYSEEILEHD